MFSAVSCSHGLLLSWFSQMQPQMHAGLILPVRFYPYLLSIPPVAVPAPAGVSPEGGGSHGSDSGWKSGIFDRGSWVESHPGWARTVVTGRARLGGMAVGVIAVETQAVTRHLPADPGMPDSSEQNIPQVWGAYVWGCFVCVC